MHQDTQAVSERSPAGWHRLKGAGRPRGCHGRGTVLPGEARVKQPGSAELTPTRAARSSVAHGTAEQDGGDTGVPGQDGSSHRARTRAPASSAASARKAPPAPVSPAGHVYAVHLAPSRPYGRFHGTAITAPGNTLLIKAKGLGCGRKDGRRGGSSPARHRGGGKNVVLDILGI